VLTLESELRELVQRFNEAKVEYALCGGMAVALHGYPRFTKDIDFLIPLESLDQARKIAAASGFRRARYRSNRHQATWVCRR